MDLINYYTDTLMYKLQLSEMAIKVYVLKVAK